MARKIEFDREETLNRSMQLFWEKGYENTSMQDLVTTLNINRFSIYNTFGDKKELFLLALEHYRSNLFEHLNTPLRDQSIRGKQRLDDYISKFGKHITSKTGVLGCLIQASAMSEISQDKEISKLVSNSFQDLHKALAQALHQAHEDGELSEGCDVKLAATNIMCTMQGLIVLRKSQKDVSPIKAQIEFLRQTVAAW